MTATAHMSDNLELKDSEGTNTSHSAIHPVAGNQNMTSNSVSPRLHHHPVKREHHSPIVDLLPAPDSEPPTEIVQYGWNHPAELEYITPEDWSPSKIISHLIANAFSVPPRAQPRSGASIVIITSINGQQIALPIGYRIPLMFLARFQWLSLKLVLTAVSRETEWSEYKFSILHVCRLCSYLLKAAQDYIRVANDEEISRGIDRKWRCPTFDRALARYRLRWFMSNPSQVQEFWDVYQNEEYKKDALKFDWRRWSLKGHRGFALTEDEIVRGIKAEQLMSGLKQKNGEWFWETEGYPIADGIDAWSLRTSVMDLPSASPIPVSSLPSPTPDPQLLPVPTPQPSAVSAVPTSQLPVAPTSQPSAIPTPQPSVPEDRTDSSLLVPSIKPSATTSTSSPPNGQPVEVKAPVRRRQIPRKSIPLKRPGSPLQRAQSPSARSSSTPLVNGTRKSRKKLGSLPLSRSSTIGSVSISPAIQAQSQTLPTSMRQDGSFNSNYSFPPPSVPLLPTLGPPAPISTAVYMNSDSISTAPSHLSAMQTQTQYLPSASSMGQQTISNSNPPWQPPFVPPNLLPNIPIPASDLHSGVPTPASSFPPPPQPIPAGENLSSEAVVRVIDSIFSGFAESLQRFSVELQQSKTEAVAEIRESLINTFSEKTAASSAKPEPELVDTFRNVVREEVHKALDEKLASLKNDIVRENQREVRDGVRIVVAVMREELVEGIQKEFRSAIGRLQDENARVLQQLQSHGTNSHPATTTPLRRESSGRLMQESLESISSLNRVSHPLQNLLGGEPHPLVSSDNKPEGND